MSDTDYPNTPHPLVKAHAPTVQRCRDLECGTSAIHKNSEQYLPRGKAEEDGDYKLRAKTRPVFNAFGRTIEAMTGLVCQRDASIDESASPELQKHWSDIDLQGTKGSVFVQRLMHDGLVSGVIGILVDYPEVTDARALTRADEQAQGLRPYWVHIRREDVITWRVRMIAGRPLFSLLVLRESVEVSDGMFGVAVQDQWRVFRRSDLGVVTVELWQAPAMDAKPQPIPGSLRTIQNQTRIPVVLVPFGTPLSGNAMEVPPPLLDLADVNIAHWMSDSELHWLAHLGCVPVPLRIGYEPPAQGGEMVIGVSRMMDLPIGGDFKWAEITGTAFKPVSEMISADEQRMANLGMAFLMAETRSAETAKAKSIDTAAQNASLAVCAIALQDGLEQALIFHANYMKQPAAGAKVNTDFEQLIMSVQEMTEFRASQAQGVISLETLWDIWERGRRLPEGFDREAERKRLAEESAAIVDAAGEMAARGDARPAVHAAPEIAPSGINPAPPVAPAAPPTQKAA